MESKDEINLVLSSEYDVLPLTKDCEGLVLSSLKAISLENNIERAYVDIVCVIDRSGSMSGEKLALVLQAMEFFIIQLSSNDRLGIVTYSNSVTVDLALSYMNVSGKDVARNCLRQIRASGSTNLSGGLIEGLNQILSRQPENSNDTAAVLMFTDGHATTGMLDSNSIVQAVQGLLQQIGVYCQVHCFGFGTSHNANLLRSISDSSQQAGGVYYQISEAENISSAFADCLGGLLSVVGQNIKINIKCLDPESTGLGEVLTKFSVNKISTHEIEISVGDLYCEEERDIIIQILLKASDKPPSLEPHPLLSFSLSYFSALQSKIKNYSIIFGLTRSDTLESSKTPNFKLDQQRNRYIAAHAMDNANQLASSNQLDSGNLILQKAIDTIKRSHSSNFELSQTLLNDLHRCQTSLHSSHSFQRQGSFMLNTLASQHFLQRSSSIPMSPYRTLSKRQSLSLSKDFLNSGTSIFNSNNLDFELKKDQNYEPQSAPPASNVRLHRRNSISFSSINFPSSPEKKEKS